MNRLTYFFALIVSIIAFGLTPIFGQESNFKTQVHEISLQMIEINHVPKLTDYYTNSFPASFNYVNGLRYTFHLNTKHAFRIGGFHRNSEFKLPEEISGFEEYDARMRITDFHLGYLYNISLGASRIHIGISGRLGFGKMDEIAGYILGGNIRIAEYDYTDYGVNGFIGYSYFLNKHISLGLDMVAYATKLTALTGNLTYTFPNEEFRDDQWGINGSFFLSFHLGEMSKK